MDFSLQELHHCPGDVLPGLSLLPVPFPCSSKPDRNSVVGGSYKTSTVIPGCEGKTAKPEDEASSRPPPQQQQQQQRQVQVGGQRKANEVRDKQPSSSFALLERGLQEKYHALRKKGADQGREIATLRKQHSKDQFRLWKLEKEVHLLRNLLHLKKSSRGKKGDPGSAGRGLKKSSRGAAVEGHSGVERKGGSRSGTMAYYRPKALPKADPPDFADVVLKLDIAKVLEDPRLRRCALKLSSVAAAAAAAAGKAPAAEDGGGVSLEETK